MRALPAPASLRGEALDSRAATLLCRHRLRNSHLLQIRDHRLHLTFSLAGAKAGRNLKPPLLLLPLLPPRVTGESNLWPEHIGKPIIHILSGCWNTTCGSASQFPLLRKRTSSILPSLDSFIAVEDLVDLRSQFHIFPLGHKCPLICFPFSVPLIRYRTLMMSNILYLYLIHELFILCCVSNISSSPTPFDSMAMCVRRRASGVSLNSANRTALWMIKTKPCANVPKPQSYSCA